MEINGPVLLEQREGVALLTLNRPPANSMNLQAFIELEQLLDTLARDPQVRAVVLTGAGDKGFCAGFDLTDTANSTTVSLKAQAVCNQIEAFPKPVVAAINGYALGGGCELALACHFRFMVAAPKAVIGLPETQLGVIPVWGGTQRLPRLIGRSRGTQMILLAERIDAEEAAQIGLVDRVCAPAELFQQAFAFAVALAKRPPLATRAVLRAIHIGLNHGMAAGLQAELDEVKGVRGSKDAEEGIRAFFEKREPRFSGE
ncbi:MAG TPA: enoyl-CoA hydratase-related protein [Pseudomonadales bacterium]|jgi:enoyl-CoA hydratase/carnithine racemase|nr:enoyl-CoA hydratase-related protein [Pseudomonadales bacterium]HMW83700.1 enoyl-CoA hydratase-related protein [Pseudomonadales bacterium]HMY97541.1 enoyl-CoA hydratase-related protein [Pseudomonadales bacterium]HMZ71292.1 enoyl-CoA hydratase-related protein [Pseudomonadales bacterium]HMZ92121.1 enoyl-CoA hydratase-related protein [Pseudomonadales bacterium]